MDSRWRLDYNDRQSAQVLRLGSSNGVWEVDLDSVLLQEHSVSEKRVTISTFVVQGRSDFGPSQGDSGRSLYGGARLHRYG